MKGDVKLFFGEVPENIAISQSHLRIMKSVCDAKSKERAIVRHRYHYLENSMRDISKQMNIPLRRVREALK